jgi:hypothetical protein
MHYFYEYVRLIYVLFLFSVEIVEAGSRRPRSRPRRKPFGPAALCRVAPTSLHPNPTLSAAPSGSSASRPPLPGLICRHPLAAEERQAAGISRDHGAAARLREAVPPQAGGLRAASLLAS